MGGIYYFKSNTIFFRMSKGDTLEHVGNSMQTMCCPFEKCGQWKEVIWKIMTDLQIWLGCILKLFIKHMTEIEILFDTIFSHTIFMMVFLINQRFVECEVSYNVVEKFSIFIAFRISWGFIKFSYWSESRNWCIPCLSMQETSSYECAQISSLCLQK